jgi:hypothetical protein
VGAPVQAGNRKGLPLLFEKIRQILRDFRASTKQSPSASCRRSKSLNGKRKAEGERLAKHSCLHNLAFSNGRIWGKCQVILEQAPILL